MNKKDEKKPETKNVKVTKTKEVKVKKEKATLETYVNKDIKIEKEKEPLTKNDILCWVGFVVCILLAILPYFLRFIDAGYDEGKKFTWDPNVEEEKPVEKVQLLCNVDKNETGYTYKVEVANDYENYVITKIVITYIVTLTDQKLTDNDIKISEYETLSLIESEGVVAEHESGSMTYRIIMDFKKDPSLKNVDILKEYAGAIAPRKEKYENEGYTCEKTANDK